MVGGSSDSGCVCQFLRDSAEQTALSRNMPPDSGRRFPLVYTCVCYFITTEREWFPEPRLWNRSVYCIFYLSRLVLYNDTFQLFNVGGCVNHSGNRQNLRKTKWRPFCSNPRFGGRGVNHVSDLDWYLIPNILNLVHVWIPIHDLNLLLLQKGCRVTCCMGWGIVLDIHKVMSKRPHRPWQHLIPQDKLICYPHCRNYECC